MMKLYKFRSLVSKDDLDRTKKILETGRFHCSVFSELNDPTEGSFTIFPNKNGLTNEVINAIYGIKKIHKICSFSGVWAFKKPIMWGHYANGFRGIAIEIEIDKSKMHKIVYGDEIMHVKDGENTDKIAKQILTTKLKSWRHEFEYRFLAKSTERKHEIGKITAVYFGYPYERAVNREYIYESNKNLKDFRENKNKLVKVASTVNVKCYSVLIEENKVQKGKLIK